MFRGNQLFPFHQVVIQPDTRNQSHLVVVGHQSHHGGTGIDHVLQGMQEAGQQIIQIARDIDAGGHVIDDFQRMGFAFDMLGLFAHLALHIERQHFQFVGQGVEVAEQGLEFMRRIQGQTGTPVALA